MYEFEYFSFFVILAYNKGKFVIFLEKEMKQKLNFKIFKKNESFTDVQVELCNVHSQEFTRY